jgi:hypothetical protein
LVRRNDFTIFSLFCVRVLHAFSFCDRMDEVQNPVCQSSEDL